MKHLKTYEKYYDWLPFNGVDPMYSHKDKIIIKIQDKMKELGLMKIYPNIKTKMSIHHPDWFTTPAYGSRNGNIIIREVYFPDEKIDVGGRGNSELLSILDENGEIEEDYFTAYFPMKYIKKVYNFLKKLTPEEIEELKAKQEADKFNF